MFKYSLFSLLSGAVFLPHHLSIGLVLNLRTLALFETYNIPIVKNAIDFFFGT